MKIAIINQGHTENIGDIAIRLTLEKFFLSRGIGTVFYPYWETPSRKKYFDKFVSHIPFLLDMFNKKRIRKYLDEDYFDAVVIGGGELLNEHRGFSSSLWIWVKECSRRAIPVYLYGVSGKESKSRNNEKKKIDGIKKCELICARDHYTQEYLKKKGIEVYYYPDVVYSFRDYVGEIDKLITEKNISASGKKEEYVVLIPIAYSQYVAHNCGIYTIQGYYDFLYDYIYEFKDKKIYISTTDQNDVSFAQSLVDEIIKKNPAIDVEFINSEDIICFLNLINRSACVISARMHAMILGFIYGIRIKPIVFKEKISTFQNELGKYKNEIHEMSKDGLNYLFDKILTKAREN